MADYNNREHDRIDRLKRGLYSRKTPDIIDSPRSTLSAEEPIASDGWRQGESSKFDVLASKVAHGAGSSRSFAKKLLLISSLLFVISLGFAAFIFLGGVNLISSKNVDIRVIGPVSIGGGQQVSFEIEVVNQNNTDLESTILTVEYPKGLRSVDDINNELLTESFSLGVVESGDISRQKIEAFIFGEKEEVKEFNLTVEYKVKNSSALFYKEKKHQIVIDSSPVIVNSIYPKEVNSNQEITFTVEAASNSEETIGDFIINVEYPFGFTFIESSPAASFADNTWAMILRKGEKRKISVKGLIAGQDNEERVFKVNAGTASDDDERKIGVLFSTSDESILVQKPFIGINLSLSGSAGDHVLASIGGVNATLNVRNNLPERIFNATVETSFSGAAFSKNSVFSGSGFFRSIDNTIIWDSRSTSRLAELGPGQDVGLNFSFTPLSYQSIGPNLAPEIKVKVKVAGERIFSSGAVEKIESSEERTVKLATNLTLNPKVVRSVGNIENSGPIPPKVEQESTYTVIWSISNTFNTAGSVEVKAVLPQYVRWTGLKSPDNEDIIFNPSTNEVMWRVNQVVAGAGFKSVPKEVAFQLSLLPSVSQVGMAPELIGPASVRGVDRVTETAVFSNAPALTINFSGDPTFRQGDDKVAP